MHQMKLVRHAVARAVGCHRRDHDAVGQRHVPQFERQEHRRDRPVRCAATGARGEPALHAVQPGAVAQAQILVADALAAGQQAVGELLRFKIGVARNVLEPFGGIARGRLQFQHIDASGRFVGGECGRDVPVGPVDGLREPDRVLQRELGAGTDGKMRGVRGIAHQHDPVLHPGRVGDAVEIDELRAAQVTHVGQQRIAVEPRSEQALAEGDRLRHVHLIETRGPPGRLARFDDECRGIVAEAIGVGLEPAPLGLDKDEGEGIEQLVRAEPGESVRARFDGRSEMLRIACADRAVDAIGCDDQVGVGEFGDVLHLALEDQFHAEFDRAFVEDAEQAPALDAAEAMAAGADDAALEMDVDVIPMDEAVADALFGLWIAAFEVAQRFVGEHHAPAERVVGAVPFDHADAMAGIAQLHQYCEVETGRAAADANDPHRVSVLDGKRVHTCIIRRAARRR